MTQTTPPALRELAHRAKHGIEVTLFWNADDRRLTVLVTDEHSHERFRIDVGDPSALDVFHHPFAYTDRRLPEPPIPWLAEQDALAA